MGILHSCFPQCVCVYVCMGQGIPSVPQNHLSGNGMKDVNISIYGNKYHGINKCYGNNISILRICFIMYMLE